MPCSILVHVHGRGPEANGDWEPGDIIVARPAGWKWGRKERRSFLPVEVSDMTEAEAVALQGHAEAKVEWEKMFDHDWQRAAVRNRELTSPAPPPAKVKRSLIAKRALAVPEGL